MKLADLTVEVRDINLNRLGQIVPARLDLLLADQFNNVGSWTLVVATDDPLAEALRTPGAGIIVTKVDGSVLLSGPTIKPESAATTTDPGGTLTVEGLTDTVILADRLAFPDPTNVDPETQTLSHDVRTGSAEALMHAYVNANIGPGAPSARRDTRLVMGTNSNRGTTMTKRARFPKLGNLLSEIAAVDGLGFRVVQVGSTLEFQTYTITDRTAEVRLDIRNNTLAGHRVATGTPTLTRAIVAGQGEQVNRQFVEVTTTDSVAAESLWGRRIEQFIDQRQTDDLDELTQAGMEALSDGGFSQALVQVVPMDDTSMEFGRDWGLGDRVTVVVEGTELYSTVTGYALRANNQGFKMGAILGDPAATRGQTADQRLTSVEARVNNLERNAEQPDISGLQSDITALTANANGRVSKSGDTMTGALTLSGAPTASNHAATKDYVDARVQRMGVTLRRNTNQTIGSGGSATAISWSVEDFDSDSMWSSGTTVTIPAAGLWSFNFQTEWSGAIGSGRAFLAIEDSTGAVYRLPIAGTGETFVAMSWTMPVAAGVTFVCKVLQSSGGSLDITAARLHCYRTGV